MARPKATIAWNFSAITGKRVSEPDIERHRDARSFEIGGSFEAYDEAAITAIFAGIMSIETGDGLVFNVDSLAASKIREEMEYGGPPLAFEAFPAD